MFVPTASLLYLSDKFGFQPEQVSYEKSETMPIKLTPGAEWLDSGLSRLLQIHFCFTIFPCHSSGREEAVQGVFGTKVAQDQVWGEDSVDPEGEL